MNESLKTFICDQLQVDNKEKYNREYIGNTILSCLKYNQDTWRIDTSTKEERDIVINSINIIKKNKNFCSLVDNIIERRNDINHFGYSASGAAPYSKFINDLDKYYNTFLEIKDSIDSSSIFSENI